MEETEVLRAPILITLRLVFALPFPYCLHICICPLDTVLTPVKMCLPFSLEDSCTSLTPGALIHTWSSFRKKCATLFPRIRSVHGELKWSFVSPNRREVRDDGLAMQLELFPAGPSSGNGVDTGMIVRVHPKHLLAVSISRQWEQKWTEEKC